jgi:CRISPR system Cascade subunit CasD
MHVMLLRLLGGPLLSFGGVAIDDVLRTDEWMSRSQLAGTIGSAQGLDVTDRQAADKLTRLQARLRYAMRQDNPGKRITDLVQASLVGSPHYRSHFFTDTFTERSTTDKPLRLRHKEYLSGADYWVAAYLQPAAESPTLDEVGQALRQPERTLYIGRLCCMPAAPIFQRIVEAPSLADALKTVPCLIQRPKYAWMDGDDHAGFPATSRAREVRAYGDRDWRRNVHTGHYVLKEASL